MKKSPILLAFALAVCSVMGCEKKPSTGGDIPVTIERITSSVLTDIKQKDFSWTFTHSTVVIENDGNPIPSDVIESLLDQTDECVKIEAMWSLSNDAKKLTLTEIKVDDNEIDREVELNISPAGAVRINIDSRQYNRMP